MSTENQENTTEGKTEGKRVQLAAIIVTAVVLVIIAVSVLTKNGSAESETSKVSKVSADASASAVATTASDAPMIRLGNPVVAVVDGKDIMRSDVFNFISGLPDQVRQMPIQTLFPLAMEQVVNNRVISMKANTSALDTDPEVEKLLDQAKGQIIRNIFVDRQIAAALTQKRILKAYGELLDRVTNIDEVKARHILVEEEEAAKELVAQLDEGMDFENLAKENSTGPSADRGGDLGYFAKGEMVPAFSEAAFGLDIGSYTKEPVKTQFGWHIIQVVEKRKRPEPKFEDVKPQLEAQLRQQILAELIEGWQKEANIKKFDINGDTVKN